MTAKEFLQKKYPNQLGGDKWNSHQAINDEWVAQMMQEYAESRVALPQPTEIETIMAQKFENRKINDEFGWTGEWRMSVKNILDLIIDLNKCSPYNT